MFVPTTKIVIFSYNLNRLISEKNIKMFVDNFF